MTDLTLQTLLDRAEISDVFHRYATGLDTRDWDLLRTCFIEDMVADFSAIWPEMLFHGVDEWLTAAKNLITGMDATQHIITNHTHDIEGDTAKCTSYFQAQHVCKNNMGDDHNLLAGHYSYNMVRTPKGWKIKDYSCRLAWNTGNASVWELAEERLKTKAAAE